MNRTTENLLTWGTIGAGLALMLSDHRRFGLAVAAVSPLTVAVQHPRAMRKALKAVPQSLMSCGEATGKAFEHAGRSVGISMRKTGHGLRWLAS